ncbi:MAG TPA: DoxX family protein [Inquilinus sp.]|nr:DoxX family protein [Inquilinus sp.]
MNPSTSLVPAVGRLLLALLFLISGFGKLAAPEATMGYIGMVGLPLPQIAYAVALLIELGGGILLLVGFQTRAVALVLAVFSLVTALSFHFDFGDQNQMVHFLKNIAITGGFLQVFAFGAGSFSLDARLAADKPAIAGASARG